MYTVYSIVLNTCCDGGVDIYHIFFVVFFFYNLLKKMCELKQ